MKILKISIKQAYLRIKSNLAPSERVTSVTIVLIHSISYIC
jgi:hypothetical protein